MSAAEPTTTTATTTTAVTLPSVPTTTPTWFIKGIASLMLVAGPVLAYIDPDGKITTPLAQAVVILVFVVGAFVIYSIDQIAEAIKVHGFTVAAFKQVETSEEAEFTKLWPEIKAEFNSAKPALDMVKQALPQVGSLTSRVKALEEKPAPHYQVDVDALAEAVKNKIVAGALPHTTAPVQAAPAPAAAPAASTPHP